MVLPLMARECGEVCKEEAEFLLKFIITSLNFKDKEARNGFQNILVLITFDGNVIRIDDFEEDDEGEMKNVGRQLTLQLTSEMLCEKLLTRPIMINLSRGCTELGTVRLNLTDCFAEAVKCEEFSNETTTNEYKFVTDGVENASMIIIFKISRSIDEETSKMLSKLFKKYAKKETSKKLNQSPAIMKPELSSPSSSSGSDTNTTYVTDLCPLAEESDDRQPKSFSLSSSTKSKNCSDSSKQIYTRHLALKGKCNKPATRICENCFQDLSFLPQFATCPSCENRRECDQTPVLFKTKAAQEKQTQLVHDCVKSIFEDIFIETKDRLMADWKRLKGETKSVTKKIRKNAKRNSKSSTAKKMKLTRCAKLLSAREESRKSKNVGLRKKHPGIIVGHRICVESRTVPKKMGWLWNVEVPGMPSIRRGWRPGAVKKRVANIMKHYLEQPKEVNAMAQKIESPTLRVQKRNGEYMIVLNSMHDEGERFSTNDPSPIVFKVMKSDDANKRVEARRFLKTRGVEKSCECSCLDSCQCLNECEKILLKVELAKVSKCMGINPELDLTDLRETSGSEIDFEFTPPSATKNKNSTKTCKINKVSYAGTQYESQIVKCGDDKDDELTKNDKNLRTNQDDDIEDDENDARKSGRPLKKKLIFKTMREKPMEKCYVYCAPNNEMFDCQPIDHRLTTNYNVINAQCPPEPSCVPAIHHHHSHNAFFCP